MHPVLQKLAHEHIYCTVALRSNAEHIRRVLSEHSNVIAVRHAITKGEVGQAEILEALKEWMGAFVPGYRLETEAALCAFAVALEQSQLTDAAKILDQLSEMDFAETPLLHRVAKKVIEQRSRYRQFYKPNTRIYKPANDNLEMQLTGKIQQDSPAKGFLSRDASERYVISSSSSPVYENDTSFYEVA